MDSYPPPQWLPGTNAWSGRAEAALPPSDPELRIRPIEPGDQRALQDGFEHLSEMSRYYRFHSPMRQLSNGLAHYLTHVDGIDHVALVAFEPGASRSDAAVGVAVARFIRDRRDPQSAELAITVVDHAQGHGVARRLLQALAPAARDRGISTFTMSVLAGNKRVRQLLKSLGATSRGSSGDVTTFALPVAALLDSTSH